MKFPTFLLLSTVAFSCFAEGEELSANDEIAMQKTGYRSLNCDSVLSILEEQMKEVYTDTVRGDFGARAPSAAPQLSDYYHTFFKADLLLWTEYEGGDDYAFTSDSTTVSVGTNKHLDFNWSWGFRVELGCRFPHDTWDTLARFTWLHPRASGAVGSPKGGVVTPLYPPFQTDNGTNANAAFKTNFSVLDIEIGKSYFLSRYFAMKPFFGLRNAWIHQTQNATYIDSPFTGSIVETYGRNDSWGIGPWGGFNTTWFFGPSWNLFTSFGGALMVADFKIVSQVLENGFTLIHLPADVTRIVSNLQGALGFGWETNFNKNRNHVAARFSYEAQVWWRQNQLLHYGTFGPPLFKRVSEDLGLHGFTFDILFDF